MARRTVLLVALLAAALLIAVAAPAGAIPPFGPIVTVANAPGGCTIDTVNGDATVSGPVIRGFFNFAGPGCDGRTRRPHRGPLAGPGRSRPDLPPTAPAGRSR